MSANFEAKKVIVEEIKAKIQNAKSVVFVKFNGLTVAEDTELRREFRKNNVEYKNDVNIHLGFEVEYFESCFDAFLEHISPYPVDYLILGQHFGDIFTEPMAHNGKQTGSHALLKDYVDNVIKAIETGENEDGNDN